MAESNAMTSETEKELNSVLAEIREQLRKRGNKKQNTLKTMFIISSVIIVANIISFLKYFALYSSNNSIN